MIKTTMFLNLRENPPSSKKTMRMRNLMKKKSMVKRCVEHVEKTIPQMNFGSVVTCARDGSTAIVLR